MADSAAQVRRVVARLRSRGFKVVEVTGWETRGSSAMTTRGRIEHHTASSYGSSDTASLRVVTFGRAGLRNSLSRWYVSRSGVIYLIALRTSWHAGPGVKGSNSTLSGTEAEHSGQTREPWTEASLAAQAAISQEEAREFGVSYSRIWDHKEHAGHRGKIDRISIDPDWWRRRLDDPAEPSTGEDMFVRHGDRGEAVQYVQLLLADVGHPPKGGADEIYGDNTAAAIGAYWQARHGKQFHGREVTAHVLRSLHADVFAGEPAAGVSLSAADQKFLAGFVAEGRERDAGPAGLWHVLDWLRNTRSFFLGRYS